MIEERVTYVLKAVNMYKFRKKNALQISGGQQQRVAIARAIVKNPDIIIADEPTGNLHSDQAEEIMKLFQKLNSEGMTIVQVTHSKENAAYGKRTINIVDGTIDSDNKH
jgi:ABC-type lipoprotein export system ATPase subunit